MSEERLFSADNTENLKKIEETTNFSRKTTLIRPKISKPHGAGMGGMKILLHVNLALVILAQKCMPKSHPIKSIVDCLQSAFSLKIHLVLISARMIANHDAPSILLNESHKYNEKRKYSSWLKSKTYLFPSIHHVFGKRQPF